MRLAMLSAAALLLATTPAWATDPSVPLAACQVPVPRGGALGTCTAQWGQAEPIAVDPRLTFEAALLLLAHAELTWTDPLGTVVLRYECDIPLGSRDHVAFCEEDPPAASFAAGTQTLTVRGWLEECLKPACLLYGELG